MSDFEMAARAETVVPDAFTLEILETAEAIRESVARCFGNFPQYGKDLAHYESVSIDNSFDVQINPDTPTQNKDGLPDTCNICYYPADVYNQTGRSPKIYFIFSEGKFYELEYWQDENDRNADIFNVSLGNDGRLRVKSVKNEDEAEATQSNQTWAISDTAAPVVGGINSFGQINPEGVPPSNEIREELTFLMERAKEDIDTYPLNSASPKPQERVIDSTEQIDTITAIKFANNIKGILSLEPSPVKPGARRYLENDERGLDSMHGDAKGHTAIYLFGRMKVIFEGITLGDDNAKRLRMTTMESNKLDSGIRLITTRRYELDGDGVNPSYSENIDTDNKNSNLRPELKTVSQTALMASLQESLGLFVLTPSRLDDANAALQECMNNPSCKIL